MTDLPGWWTLQGNSATLDGVGAEPYGLTPDGDVMPWPITGRQPCSFEHGLPYAGRLLMLELGRQRCVCEACGRIVCVGAWEMDRKAGKLHLSLWCEMFECRLEGSDRAVYVVTLPLTPKDDMMLCRALLDGAMTKGV